jgi:hypothetical protein
VYLPRVPFPRDSSDPLHSPGALHTENDTVLRQRLAALSAEGWARWEAFAARETERPFHPFVAADYEVVSQALWPYRRSGLRFLEWGSATGVITVMADLLGMEACGIELDSRLTETARTLGAQFSSAARFVTASFLPAGYRWQPADGDGRPGTLGTGPSGYLALGHALDDFDLVFGYPWDGEEPMMLDLMVQYGRADAVLLLHSATEGVRAFQGGRQIPGPPRHGDTRTGPVPRRPG